MSAQLPFRQSALPSTLLRAFDEREYAQQFIEGRLRFGLLEHYKRSEDCRQDRTEGRASLTLVGGSHRRPVYYSLSSPNPHYYIICTIAPGGMWLHDRQIWEDSWFTLMIRLKFSSGSARFGSTMHVGHHRLPMGSGLCYTTKTIERKPHSDTLYSDCLVYAQKPSAYEMDREHRYVLECRSGTKKDEFLTLDVGTCTDICIPIFP